MKKTYQIPQINIVKIQTAQMLAVSAEMYGKNATGEAMSRDVDFSEDDDF